MTKVSHDSETPAHGQQVITACAFIHHNFDGVEKVFLPKRAATKKFLPNVFELPGGHIDFGEDLLSGLKREILEEMGKEAAIGDPFAAFTYANQIKGSHSIEVVYFAEFVGGVDDIRLHPEDHSGYDWFSEADVVARRPEIVPSEHVTFAHEDDPEYLTILRGFALLRGEKLNFA
jgi:8-oxo-dGTP pyrophosphatase MutT (NUDIX family)